MRIHRANARRLHALCVTSATLVACHWSSLGCRSADEQKPEESTPPAALKVQPVAAVSTAKPEDEPDQGSLRAPFVDVTRQTNLNFVHFNGMTGKLYFCEPVGAGAALFDYDNDGDLDVYLVQGALFNDGTTYADAIFPPDSAVLVRDRLFRNDLSIGSDGQRSINFVDVTDASGIVGAEYGMGVTTGDYNNDGWMDLYVTNFGHNRLWRNNGDGTFVDETEHAGVDDVRWNVGAAFVDYDRDGHLDLFVTCYTNFSIEHNKKCYTPGGSRDYCGPSSFEALPDRLFHNNGDGTFADVSADSGVSSEYGPGLGVVAVDVNGDGWMDIYVTNDASANQCWTNLKNGKFKNTALLAGCAYNADGKAEASMGIDAADHDNDGDIDLFITHLHSETNTLYENDGRGFFEDHSFRSGLALPSRELTGFGTGWIDFDNDGLLDIVIANGSIKREEERARKGDKYPLSQRNLALINQGGGRYLDVSATSGAPFAISEVSRGLAMGDIDNDGDVDFVLSNNSGPARILLNDLGQENHWVGLRLLSGDGTRDLLGAVAILQREDGAMQRLRCRTDASYGSSNDPRLIFGVGTDVAVGPVRVLWPDGNEEEWPAPAVDTYTALRQGSGAKPAAEGKLSADLRKP